MEIKYHSRFIEHSLIFLTVTFFSQTVLSILADILNFTDKIHVSIFTYIFIFAMSFIFFIFFENYFSSKSKGANQFRFIIFFSIFLFILCWFLKQFIVPALVIPISFGIFIFYSAIFEVIYFHDDLEEECEGKTGEKLGNDLFHNRFLGEDFLKSLNSKHTIFIVISFLLLFFICALSFTVIKPSFFTYFCAFIYFLSIFYLLYLLQVYKKEIFYAFLGFEKQWNYRSKTIIFSTFILIAAVFVSLLFSSNKALLNVKFLFSPKEDKPVAEQQITSSTYEFNDFDSFDPSVLNAINDKPLPKFVEILITIIQIALFAGIAIGILIFLFQPFINKQFSNHLKERRLNKFFKTFFANFAAMIKKLFSFKFHREVYSTIDSTTFKNSIMDLVGRTKKSKEKKAELDRLTIQFLRLIEWGTSKDVIYKQNLAPAEYTHKLIEYFLLNNFDKYVNFANRIGFLFEKALYSKDLLSKEEENEFNSSIQIIVTEG